MQTLKQNLEAYQPQEREQIFRLWGMSGSSEKDQQKRQQSLLHYARCPIAARFVWENLSQDEREVLYRVLTPAARGGAMIDATIKKTGLPEERFTSAVTKLKKSLLLWENTTKIKPPINPAYPRNVPTVQEITLLHPYMESLDTLYNTGKELFSSKSDRSTWNLDKLLTTEYHGDIYTAAERYGITVASGGFSQVELRRAMEDRLKEPNGAYELLQQLDKPSRDLIKWLCEQGGKASMEAVRTRTHYCDAELVLMLHGLENFAIAFDTLSEQGRLLFVPQNIFESIKKGVAQKEPEIVRYELVPIDEPHSVQPAQSTLLYDLAIIAGAVYQQVIEPTQAGAVPKRIANKIQPLLHGQSRSRYANGSDEYLDMLFNIALEVNVLRLVEPLLEGLKQRYEPDTRIQQWARLSLVEQTWKLVQTWFDSFSWLDIRGYHFRQWDAYYWNPNVARRSILEQLLQCTPGVWYSMTSLLDKIWDKDPFEMRPVRYNFRPADRQKSASLRAKWNSCEGEVYIGLISSTLFEMGLVSLGYQHSNALEANAQHALTNPDAFMLTDLGARILFKFVAQMMETQQTGGTKKKPASVKLKTVVTELAPMPETALSANGASDSTNADGHRSLVLQPNFELLLLEPDMPTLYSLLPFAQVNQVEMVSRLTLTRNSVLRGLQAGQTIEQILETLTAHSQKEVPQNVAYTLRDWVRLYKDVKISQVFLIEVSSDSTADEICASPKLAAFKLRKIAPCLVVAGSEVNLQELQRILDKEGIAVRLSGKIVTPQTRYSYSYF